MSQQTENMAAALPQFAALYRNSENGHSWELRRSYASKREEISEQNSKRIMQADGSPFRFSSRTAALRAQAERAKSLASAAGIVAEENKAGAWGCWRTADKAGKACFMFILPVPKDIPAEESAKPAKAASKPAKAAHEPKAASAPKESASAQRRRIAAEQSAQKQAADQASADSQIAGE